MNITIGSDVEVFARNKDGKAVALCGLIGGTKQKPKQLTELPAGYMVQEDNVSLEYNIPVCTSVAGFTSAIGVMRNEVEKILSKLNLVSTADAAISFDADQLEHPQAKVFGCEPDYNAWTKTENRKPTAENKNLRTAGGHIHVGTNEVDMILGIRAMDLFLGVPAVILDSSPASVLRRELYGKAGAMRPKPYGFEYRVLSNFWMFDAKLTEWVAENTYKAMEWARKGSGNDLTLGESAGIQECINTGNVELAKEIVAKYNIPMPGDKKPVKVMRQPRSSLKDFTFDLEVTPQTFTVPHPAPVIHMANINQLMQAQAVMAQQLAEQHQGIIIDDVQMVATTTQTLNEDSLDEE